MVGPPKFFLDTLINIVWLDGSGFNVDALYTKFDWFDVAIIAAAESPSSNLYIVSNSSCSPPSIDAVYVIEPTTMVDSAWPLPYCSLCLEPENDAIVKVPPLIEVFISAPGYMWAPLWV